MATPFSLREERRYNSGEHICIFTSTTEKTSVYSLTRRNSLMNERTLFDGQRPTDCLPHWATITQVSTFLAVPRTTVRGTVRRALCYNEPWVKREDAGDEKSPYLIDTTHETYASHAQRWKQNQAIQEEGLDDSQASQSSTGQSFFSSVPSEEPPTLPYTSSSPRSPLSWYGSNFDGVLDRWPRFRSRLYSWGIQIF